MQKLPFNALLTGLMSEIDYKYKKKLIGSTSFFSNLKNMKGNFVLWYNRGMIQMIFTFCSHLLFISFAYHLLSTVVQWEHFLKVTAETAVKIRLLILLISISLGYLTSSFFISIYEFSRQLFNGNF